MQITNSYPTRNTEKNKDISIAPQLASIYQLLSLKVWGKLPSAVQRTISKWTTRIYEQSWSKYLIKPYCWYHYKDANYLNQFVPPNNKNKYYNFQDFFSREFKKLPAVQSKHCLLYTSPSPRDATLSRMPSSA